MRTIFITPILWKKLDRAALRRGEEGQALVIIALVILGLVAMVGLSVDGGVAYLASTQLQRAADAAALAGVQWIPNNPTVADARAALSAESNGIRVACYYDFTATSSEYDTRCHRATVDQVNSSKSSQDLYSMTTSTPIGTGIRYAVTLTKKQQRLFLAFLGIFQAGFDEFTISRSATAQFSQLVRFGASFNYFGSNGVLQDHYMRCGTTSLADCAGSGSDLTMRGATYQKYVVMRCNQPNAPSPCVGGFWGHIAGQDLVHASGDAYTPIRDGGAAPSGGCGIDSSCINTDNVNNSGFPLSRGCLNTSDPNSWFVKDVYGNCPSLTGGNPVQNQDIHPDSPGGQKGFGYEIGIQADPNAIYSYAETQANLANHTNLNITIFDGGMNETSNNQLGVGDNFQADYSAYANFPAGNWSLHRNRPSDSNQWQTRQLLCSPGSNTNCTTPAVNTGEYSTPPRLDSSNNSINNASVSSNLFRLFPDQNNVELTYNDMRTRFTLYGPPVNDSIPSTYQNVSGGRIDSFEATDTSIRRPEPQYTYPIDSTSSTYCYFIFDDQKQYWNNTRDIKTSAAASTRAPGGSGPDFAPTGSATTSRYSYVCPDWIPTENNTTVTTARGTADYRWNVLQGTPTARYGAYFNDSTRTIESGILPADSGTPSDIATSPIVTATLGASIRNNQLITANVTDPQLAGVPSIWTPTVTTSSGGLTYTGVADPGQNCRLSAEDTDGWPIDSQWGHNRIPFNMAYGDPLVDRAWVTDTNKLRTNTTTPVASKALAGYYTLEYGFHGWRCDWDFDSNYVNNPLKNPNAPHDSSNNPSLSEAEASQYGVGKFNKAFAEGHPGLTSNGTMAQLLGSDNASSAEICRDMLPAGSNYTSNCNIQVGTSLVGDKEFGLEPYFHLSNVAWVNGTIGLNTNPLTQVRSGTYMVHVQTFGGSGANRYSLKAEYENPKVFRPTNLDGTTFAGLLTPVPNVFALTAMGIYANNQIQGNQTDQNIVFDLANIPPDNAGTLAIVQLWDAGDVNGKLDIEVRQPSGWGPRINTNNSNNPSSWTVPWPTNGGLNVPLTTRLEVCPYAFNPSAVGITSSCTFSSGAGRTAWTANGGGGGYYNDEWMLLSFSIPNAGAYATWKQACATHNVPENLCYYFQINYHLQGSGASANDTTTWQLVVQGQPIHLVSNS